MIENKLERIRARASSYEPVEIGVLAALVDNPYYDTGSILSHVEALLASFRPKMASEGEILDALHDLRREGEVGEDVVVGPEAAGRGHYLTGSGMIALLSALREPVRGFSRDPVPFFLKLLLIRNLRLQTTDPRLRALLKKSRGKKKFRYRMELADWFGSFREYRRWFGAQDFLGDLLEGQVARQREELARVRKKEEELAEIQADIDENWEELLEAEGPPGHLKAVLTHHTFADNKMARALFLKQVQVERQHLLAPYLKKLESDRVYLERLAEEERDV